MQANLSGRLISIGGRTRLSFELWLGTVWVGAETLAKVTCHMALLADRTKPTVQRFICKELQSL